MGMWTLLATAFVVLLVNPAVVGADKISGSGEPILDGFRAIFPNSQIAALLSLFALAGLVASFQGIMFAAGRNMYSLSRAGYYPKFLSLTGSRKVPYVALIGSAVIGLALVYGWSVIKGEDNVTVAGSLLNIAVFGAVIAYVLQMVSFYLLRRKYPNVSRPYLSRVGIGGAIVAGVIAALTLIILPTNSAYQQAVIGVAIFYVIGILYFALFGRNRLVLSPEEEYAMTSGMHGHPETEGYDVTEREMEAKRDSGD